VHADAPLPEYAPQVKVWALLVAMTFALVLASRLGPAAAVLGLLTLTPCKAGLVLYHFMHLKAERPLFKVVLLVTLGTLLILFTLLFSDSAFR
jgi:cytochrome c oxidase subunit IV